MYIFILYDNDILELCHSCMAYIFLPSHPKFPRARSSLAVVAHIIGNKKQGLQRYATHHAAKDSRGFLSGVRPAIIRNLMHVIYASFLLLLKCSAEFEAGCYRSYCASRSVSNGQYLEVSCGVSLPTTNKKASIQF